MAAAICLRSCGQIGVPPGIAAFLIAFGLYSLLKPSLPAVKAANRTRLLLEGPIATTLLRLAVPREASEFVALPARTTRG